MYVKYTKQTTRKGFYCSGTGTGGQPPPSWSCNQGSLAPDIVEGGNKTTTRPPSAKHFVKGVWLATPYTQRVTNVEYSEDAIVTRNPAGNGWNRRIGGQLTIPNTQWDEVLGWTTYGSVASNLEAKTEVDALLALSQGKVNLGEALAEVRETLRMLAEAAGRLAKVALDAKHGKWRNVSRALGLPSSRSRTGDLSQRWLEYQYGWKPLMGDIFGLTEEIREGLAKHHMVISVTRSNSSATARTYSYGTDLSYADRRRTYAVDLGVTVNLVFQVSNPAIAKLSALGLLNPAAVAWSRVPWSFVVDWFIPVSSYLQAFTAAKGYTFLTGCRTRRVYASTANFPYAIDANVKSHRPAVGKAEGILVSRAVKLDTPVPTLYSNPHPFSTTRLANAIALFDSRLQVLRR